MPKAFRFPLLLLIFKLCIRSSFAQEVTVSVDSVFSSFANRPPMEKLYLHTDRNIYSTGGTIWFRAYLLTATGNFPATMSNFIYVELYDQADSLVCRKKIKKIDGVFSGNIKLEPTLQEGSYFIRAYSMWMLNQGLDNLFYKAIHIGSLQTHKITSKIDFRKNDVEQQTASIYFADKNGDPVTGTRVKCTLHSGNSKAEVLTRTTGDDGKINFDFNPENNGSSNQFIEVEFEKSEMEYNTKFFLEKEDEGQLDVQFFPEGGDLIDGVSNRVAFKAIGSDGYSRTVRGVILNAKNDTITNMASEHLGMGAFYMIPETGVEYHAEIRDAENRIVLVPLPHHFMKGAALTVVSRGESIHLNVRQQNFNAIDSYYIMAYSGESLLFIQKLNNSSYKIPKDIFPEGIVNFALLNDKKETISCRMVFIRKEKDVNLQVQPNKENYQRRDSVFLKLSMLKQDTTVHSGSFSIAVTDDLVVNIDSLSDNICTSLLLTSDLKGYVEEPGFYFLNNADSTNFYLDLLMLTQGWKRFDLNELLQHGVPPANYYLELGQTLAGNYQKMLLQKNKTTEIKALAVDPVITASTFTDENSNFIFNELDFPENTTFIVRAERFTNIKQEPAGIITFDKDTFPSFQHAGVIPHKTEGFTGKAFENATERVYYEDGGKMIVLDEIEIKVEDKTKKMLESKYGISSNVFDQEKIARTFPVSQPIDFVIRTLPGVSRIENGSVFLSRGIGAAEILVDGMEQTLADIGDLYSDNIDHIATIVGAGAAVYSRKGGANGVIIISLKEGGQYRSDLKGVKKITPLGYQKPVEFYVPKYEIDSVRMVRQPDMRSTVFWKSNVTIQDGEKTTVRFYTADPSTTYTYIIEGVDDGGNLYRTVGKLRREDE